MVQTVGFVGWRGMVGSVLMQRMREENDFKSTNPVFFSTSNAGGKPPRWAEGADPLQDAYSVSKIKKMPIIVTMQGEDYTKSIYGPLRNAGWRGIWIDASSALRMNQGTTIILDPVNRHVIDTAISQGVRSFAGGNCTVNCMLMGLSGLFKQGLVEWLTSMSYQAASGGGAKHVCEMLIQFGILNQTVKSLLHDPSAAILDIDRNVLEMQKTPDFPQENFEVPLAGNIIPWIDRDLSNGKSREEWKLQAESNKILGRGTESEPIIPMDGLCVRVGAMRCHSQAITLKLKRCIPIKEIEQIVAGGTQWTKVIPNSKESTLRSLTPVSVCGTLDVPVGRLRTLSMGPSYLGAFTIGDQLLWGAAEPLRRMLKILAKQA